MPIKTSCECGATFAVPDQLAGKRVKCPKCAQPTQVPGSASKTEGPGAGTSDSGAAAHLTISCGCGKRIRVPRQSAGKAVKCPGCGKPLLVPAAPAAVAAAELPSGEGLGDLLDEVELGTSKTGRRCPECRNDLQPDDLICVKCGYHTETGKRITTKRVEGPPRLGSVVMNPTANAKPKEAPPAVLALAKLLNQVGMLVLLAAILFTAYRGFSAMQAEPSKGIDALIASLTGVGVYVIGGALLLGTVPYAVAANLVQSGQAAGRILSIGLGALAAPLLLGVLIVKLAISDEVARYCR